MIERPVVQILEARAQICREILAELPEWFGIPEAVEQYVSFAEQAEMLAGMADTTVAGFVVLRDTSDIACDIYLMAVRPAFHRCGFGTALIDAAARRAKRRGCRYLTVKTVGPSRVNAAYAATRQFYAAVGFEPIEEFADLWDGNPCLLLLRPL